MARLLNLYKLSILAEAPDFRWYLKTSYQFAIFPL